MVTFICARANVAAKNQNTQFQSPEDVTFINPGQFAAGIGTISFAFVCQHSSFIVFRSMKEGTLANWTKVANYSLLIAGVLCLLLGLVAYLAFGSHTKADVLTNFGKTDELILVARLLLAITMLFTVSSIRYWLLCFVSLVYFLLYYFSKLYYGCLRAYCR